MAEESTVANEALPGTSDPLRQFVDMMRRGDIALALGIVAILVVLILPMPTWIWTLWWRGVMPTCPSILRRKSSSSGTKNP